MTANVGRAEGWSGQTAGVNDDRTATNAVYRFSIINIAVTNGLCFHESGIGSVDASSLGDLTTISK